MGKIKELSIDVANKLEMPLDEIYCLGTSLFWEIKDLLDNGKIKEAKIKAQKASETNGFTFQKE